MIVGPGYVNLDQDADGWFATTAIDGEPLVWRMPPGYHPDDDEGRAVVALVNDWLNEREAADWAQNHINHMNAAHQLAIASALTAGVGRWTRAMVGGRVRHYYRGVRVPRRVWEWRQRVPEPLKEARNAQKEPSGRTPQVSE